MISNLNIDYSNEQSLRPYLIRAVAIHIGVVVLFVLSNFLFGLKLFDFKDTDYKVEVIQSAVRVDVVGMPKFTVKELKEAVVEAPVKGADSAKKTKPLESEVETSSFNSFLNKYSKKDIDKPKGKTRGSETSIDRKRINSLVLEGNKVSQGTSLVGDALKQKMTAYNTYVGNLPNIVRPHWKLPTYLMDKALKCRVRVYISSSGSIIKSEIFESSGTQEFDDRALRALKEVGSFPPPPSEVVARLSAGDVILGFPL